MAQGMAAVLRQMTLLYSDRGKLHQEIQSPKVLASAFTFRRNCLHNGEFSAYGFPAEIYSCSQRNFNDGGHSLKGKSQ